MIVMREVSRDGENWQDITKPVAGRGVVFNLVELFDVLTGDRPLYIRTSEVMDGDLLPITGKKRLVTIASK